MSTAYVCLAGPTASGKTAAALAIARVLPGEIVSGDSALAFSSMAGAFSSSPNTTESSVRSAAPA